MTRARSRDTKSLPLSTAPTHNVTTTTRLWCSTFQRSTTIKNKI